MDSWDFIAIRKIFRQIPKTKKFEVFSHNKKTCRVKSYHGKICFVLKMSGEIIFTPNEISCAYFLSHTTTS